MNKQDRQPARTPSQLERKWDWGKTFAEVYGLIDGVQTETLKAVNGLDKKLNHEEIFNRLTNYGTVQGIYRSENDDIYINASYIKSGTLSADRIDADNLKVKAANITGELTIGQLPSGVAQTKDIPTKVSALTNDSGYQTASGVTTIVGGVVTTDYVNALGISVAAAKITGLLSANQIKLGGKMSIYQEIDSDDLGGYFGYVETKVSMAGVVKFSGKGVGLDSSGHIILTTSNGNTAIASRGDILLATSGYVSTYGNALRFNDVNVAYSASDLRLKKNIDYNVSDKLISVFDGLKPVTFEMGKDFVEGQNHIGFIAQDVAESVTNAGLGNALIATDCNGMHALNYGEITAVLTAKIKQLESRLNELEGMS